MIAVSVSPTAKATGGLTKLLQNVKDKRRLLATAGRYMVETEVPRIFRQGGPPGAAWAPPKMRKGRPLRDTGRLLASIAYRANASDVRIGTPLRYAPTQQRGATIVPKGGKKWLAIPLCPPLSESQRQNAKPRDFHGAFVLIHGPEGPGLYRKTGSVIGHVSRSHKVARGKGEVTLGRRSAIRAVGIERIFAFAKSVKVPARPFLVWTPRAVGEITKLWSALIAGGVPGVKKVS